MYHYCTYAVCDSVDVHYLCAYVRMHVCERKWLTESEGVDERRERRRDTMDLLREAKSSISAKLGSTPMQSSCNIRKKEETPHQHHWPISGHQGCVTSLMLHLNHPLIPFVYICPCTV